MILFLISFIASSFSPEKYISLVQKEPESTSEDESKSNFIQETSRVDKCFKDVTDSLNNLCINLDSIKKKKLAVSIMICEQLYDGRGDQLPRYENDDQFISELDTESFGIYTTIFTSLDTICYHAAHEKITINNLQKVFNVYKAVSLSTQFLIKVRNDMNIATSAMKDKLVDVQNRLDDEAETISKMQDIITNLFDEVNNITEKASYYKNSITNTKLYLYSVGIGFCASLILPNVFLPILFITGIFLFIEVNFKPDSFILKNGMIFKWSYICFSLLIFVFAIWNQLDFFRIKVFGVKKQKKRNGIPIMFSQ